MVRKLASPYNVNAVALACLPAALEDKATCIATSPRCDADGRSCWRRLAPTAFAAGPVRRTSSWPAWRRTPRLRGGHVSRGILLRDRSAEPGCAGCVRITVAHRADGLRLVALHESLREIGLAGGHPHEIGPDRPGKTRRPASPVALVTRRSGSLRVSTGIRFFDHMLESSPVTADSTSSCRPLAISRSTSTTPSKMSASPWVKPSTQALGDKCGIARAGSFLMPMDEALALAAVDFGGRSAAVVQTKVRAVLVGDLQGALVTDFFEGFARGARANVHVRVLYGRSAHHKIEALFKAFARAVGAACRCDPRLEGTLPSTKGLL